MKFVSSITFSDKQEIGSLTSHGADSNFLPTVLTRLSSLPTTKDTKVSTTAFEESLSKSFLISADMAHAVHPNYSSKYEDKHKPKLNEGVVLKVTTPTIQR
jgi:aspartyl aminopeptidase